MNKIFDINPLKKMEMPPPKSKSLWGALKRHFLNITNDWQIFLAVLLTALFVWKLLVFTGVLPSATFPRVDENKWQAVFLNNGQVYFGKLREVNQEYVSLARTYYLRTAQNLQSPSSQQPQVSLVKLGSEIHGPEDTMYLPKSQITFWENMKDDSSVVQLIKQQEGL